MDSELLIYLNDFFTICCIHYPRLSATKPVVYTKIVKGCGRIIEEKGYQLDPRNIEALRNLEILRSMKAPITATEQCQFIHCC